MKKFLLALLVVAAPVAAFTSCSDDDDDDDGVLSEVAAGRYTGSYDATLAKGSMTVDITRITSGTRATEGGGSTGTVYVEKEVDIQIGALNIEAAGMNLSFGKIEGVKLSGKSKNISIASQKVTTTISGLAQEAVDAEITLAGNIKDGKLELTASSFKVDIDDATLAGVIGALTVKIEAEK